MNGAGGGNGGAYGAAPLPPVNAPQPAAFPVLQHHHQHPQQQQQQHSPMANGNTSPLSPSQANSHNSGMSGTSTGSHFPAVYPQLMQRNPLSTGPYGSNGTGAADATSPLSPAPGSGATATSLYSLPTTATGTSVPPGSGTSNLASSQGYGGYPSSMQSSMFMTQSQPNSQYTQGMLGSTNDSSYPSSYPPPSGTDGYTSHGSSMAGGAYSAYSSFVPGPGGLPIPGFSYAKANGASSNGFASSTISAYNGLQPSVSESLAAVAPQPIMASRGPLPLGHSTQPARPSLGPELSCSCPMICVVATNQGQADALPLPIRNLQFQAQCHISTAFVNVQLLCDYPAVWNEAPLVFFLPKSTDTTITDILIENTVRPSVFATAVVPMEDAKKMGLKKGSSDGTGGPALEPGLDPEMLILPMPAGLPGDQYKVTLTYFHPMVFEEGRYVLRLPTSLPLSALPQGASINGLLDISVTVNSGSPSPVDFSVPSHPHTLIHSQPGSVAIEADAERPWENVDFVVGYRVWRDSITATVHVEPPIEEGDVSMDNPDPRGSFCVSVSPPGPEASVAFPRSVVFMLDRSGSMKGDPMTFARTALINGLRMLGPQDEFSVVVFDHQQVWWTDRLVDATGEQVASCAKWIASDVTARGTTDIARPLAAALRMLAAARYLPFVFLITDGCVDDETTSCTSVQADMDRHSASVAAAAAANAAAAAAASAAASVAGQGSEMLSLSGVSSNGTTVVVAPAPRVCCFGIGPYCNHYFLKQLSTIGRGLFDVAFRPQAIQVQMERMLAASALPLLSDVTMSVQGLTSCELYPFPVPDLFCGQPLLVAGKYEGSWPEAIDLNGNLPNGAAWVQSVVTLPAGTLPLHKLFVRNQLDLMTAQAWLAGNPPHLVQRIVELSVASGVQSAHTVTVGFETTPERYQAYKKLPNAARNKRIRNIAIGGAAAVGIVAGVGVALAFGDIMASIANTPVGDVMGGADLSGMFGEMGANLDCCGGDCGDCCGDCSHCAMC